jgi:hypothetical protein
MSLTPRIDKLERNYIINGGFDFWQRFAGNINTVNTATPIATYTADRWSSNTGGSTVKQFSVQRSTDVPIVGLQYSCQVTSNTAHSFIASDVISPIQYRMEGYDYRNLIGKDVVVSFWAKCSITGLHTFGILAANFTKTYTTTFNVTTANTWQHFQIPVTLESNTSGYNLTNGTGIQIFFFGVGGTSTTNVSNGSFNAGNFGAAAGVVNWMSTNGATAKVAGVMLTEGTSQPNNASFHRAGGTSLSNELMMCQRYYEKSYDVDTIPGTVTDIGNTTWRKGSEASTLWRFSVEYKVSKRASSTVISYSNRTGGSGVVDIGNSITAAASIMQNGHSNFSIEANGSVGNAHINAHWTADAEL